MESKEIRETLQDAVFEVFEHVLEAQLAAVRRLRKRESAPQALRPRKSRSQIDFVEDILRKAARPLHISQIIKEVRSCHDVELDRESLVSALSKKVARGERFARTDKNTFALLDKEAK